jgi:hypothetical protein
MVLEEICERCGHIHGEYAGVMDAMSIVGSVKLPDDCKEAASRYIKRVTRRL